MKTASMIGIHPYRTAIALSCLWLSVGRVEFALAQACGELPPKLTSSNVTNSSNFGEHVAINGDITVVGARLDNDFGTASGAAFVFLRDPMTGVWTEHQQLLAFDGSSNDFYGESVAITGEAIFIGAKQTSSAPDGGVYVYQRSQETGLWQFFQLLEPSDGNTGTDFGAALAVDGDRLLVGATHADGFAISCGAAYVFEHDAKTGTWIEQQKLITQYSNQFDQAGYAVALHGDYAILGAPFDDDFGTSSGAAFIFERSPSTGMWSHVQKLAAADPHAGDDFGYSVAIGDGLAIVGSPFDDDFANMSGSVYVFVRNVNGTWSQFDKFNALDPGAQDFFGVSVLLNGDKLVVGATGDDDIASGSGAVHAFEKSPEGNEFSFTQKLIAPTSSGFSGVGVGLAVSGDTILGGADWGSGAVHVFGCILCPADISPAGGNGDVNVDDLLAVINTWGPCADCPTDIMPFAGDDVVNVDDLLAVINGWGPCS